MCLCPDQGPRPVTVWTVSVPGPLHTAQSFCRAHGDVTHGGPGVSVCEQFVLLPTALNAFWISVEAGLFTNLF